MAEGIVNHFLGDRIEAFSAGTVAMSVNPRAIRSMHEIGIDISAHRSKSSDEFAGQTFDYVMTLCDTAREQCPVYFGGVKPMHRGFDDPAGAAGSEEAIMQAFRRVRDEIRDELLKFFAYELHEGGGHGNRDR